MRKEKSEPFAFVAYPSSPVQLVETIERAIAAANATSSVQSFRGWPENDIAGRPLTGPILDNIESASFIVADVTVPNFNVTYEIGFAIGAKKRAFLIRNDSIQDNSKSMSKIGIFDTLGYVGYSNAESLADSLTSGIDQTPLETEFPLDRKAPVYVLESPIRSDAMLRIISRVKKARLQFRSFNPSEDIRMSAIDAVEHVAASHGVVVPLLPQIMREADIHNIRGAFVAGLAHGMEKPTLILQDQSGPIPLDIRDFAKLYQRIEDIDEHVHRFALDVVESTQESEPIHISASNPLAQITIGDPMAENEFQTLDRYYLRRDEFERTVRGEVNLVVGRKGVGKTALFSQVRNHLRRDKAVIVVDLKPEGFQLVKLKEAVLDYLTEGAKGHLVTAFWEYLLLLEVAHKLLEKDKTRQRNDHTLRPHYHKLEDSYRDSPYSSQGDFSERLIDLSSFLSDKYSEQFGTSRENRLTSDEVTEVLHTNDLKVLRDRVSTYLDHKKGVWILFDNLDKGWSLPGPNVDDILILRCLIDASRKIQREMQRKGHDFHSVVFVRNDVYQLLMKESSDFGKEMPVSLDWSDAEMLRELLRLRLVQNGYDPKTEFGRIWTELCVSHYRMEETSQYLIDRCLMRPRNLLKVFSHCKGFAVNLRHPKIEPEDIEKGINSYSNDLLIEANQELANIEPAAEDIIYHFLGEDWKFSRDELEMLFEEYGLSEEKYDQVASFLLYFGFFGIQVPGQDPVYIYDVGYDMKVLEVQTMKHINHIEYALNPAFWPALGVGPE